MINIESDYHTHYVRANVCENIYVRVCILFIYMYKMLINIRNKNSDVGELLKYTYAYDIFFQTVLLKTETVNMQNHTHTLMVISYHKTNCHKLQYLRQFLFIYII